MRARLSDVIRGLDGNQFIESPDVFQQVSGGRVVLVQAMFRAARNGALLWQWFAVFQNCLHPRQKDPLQPLFETQGGLDLQQDIGDAVGNVVHAVIKPVYPGSKGC
jgi:hypothetical protein